MSLNPLKNRRLCFDIETDGLLDVPLKDRMTKVHCMAVQDIDTREEWFYDPTTIDLGIDHLTEAACLMGHNIINFDIRAIQYVYPKFDFKGEVIDSLIMTKIMWPADVLEVPDFKRFRQGTLPGQMIKRQGLEAWGYRLGVMKGTYGKTADWKTYTPEMGEYNKVDVHVNVALWDLIQKRLKSEDYEWPMEVFAEEFKLKKLLTEQETLGWPFAYKDAVGLMRDLQNANEELEDQLQTIFGSWWEPQDDPKVGTRPASERKEKMVGQEDITIPRFSEKTGKELKPYVGPPLCEYSPDAPFVRVKRIKFNPSSRAHLGKRLQDVFGWKPLVFGGASGDTAKIDESTLEEIPPEVLPSSVRELILNYFVVAKTWAALSKGRQSWLSAFREDTGSIHGQVDQNGTITSRATHSKPNIAQVPSVLLNEIKNAEGKVISKEPLKGISGRFGWEARSLFVTKPGWKLTGTDASSLELKCLGHHLAPFDDGKFAVMMSDDTLDPHTENSKITGLSRADTKTVTYAFLYGAGPLKIGIGVGFKEEDRESLLKSSELSSYLRFMKKMMGDKFEHPDETTCCYIARGQKVKQKFLAGIAGLKEFRKHTQTMAEERGYLIGIDGRKIVVRKPHASVNTLLQGDGAIICKQWNIKTHGILTSHGLKHGLNYIQHGWIHDELQIGHEEKLGDLIGKTSLEAMQEVGKDLKFRGSLKTEFKIGNSWAETH